MSQEQIQPQRREPDPGDVPAPPVPTAPVTTSVDDAGLDSVLDEIDLVLESNAEEFVKGFVQKGGQ
ncbi:ubiquitin-like protein Pup [Arsenicicoccus sp. oral taxon 190]|uniref:ubiquitin-like protein Pup n=1 Tax=Arsenicicoccus sp. oral taxon 190 TaxID=1658671 RepID=UPI00067A2489|nr:ubiquitin-like protein Pup [Arsenicicoccus sp. oral taxon 190]AKT51916.1 ubiquitin [Arsenicicoccus sp. oral taxon 190]